MSVSTYLARLGLDVDLPPTLDTLSAIHRAHALRVPYENLGIMLGRPPSVLPADSLERVASTGRAGYCFHQNGALEAALVALGFSVERRFGHVWTQPEHHSWTELNHLVLVVTDLPTDANPGGRWWPDVGLGEGFVEPLPLLPGTYADGPLNFTIGDIDDDGWVFTNDPSGSFTGLEARPWRVDRSVVEVAHVELSTPPDGPFTKVLVVQRRASDAMHTVRGCVAIRIDSDGRHERDLATYDDWRTGLDDIGLPLHDVDADDLHRLFDRMLHAHRAWDAAGRP